MNENFINNAKESIQKQNFETNRITQLRLEMSGDKNEYEKLLKEVEKEDLPENDIAAMLEYIESFKASLNRKSKEIIPLLENEIEMHQSDLESAEKYLQSAASPEETSTYKEQIDYLKGKLNNLQQEMQEYQDMLPGTEDGKN